MINISILFKCDYTYFVWDFSMLLTLNHNAIVCVLYIYRWMCTVIHKQISQSSIKDDIFMMWDCVCV